MEKYKYLVANTENNNITFVILDSASTFTYEELAKKLNLLDIISHGELQSTDPAYTLPESEILGQQAINDISPDRFYTGDIMNFGFGHHVYMYIAEGDEYLFQRVVSNLSNATLAESGFIFASAV